MRLQFRPGSTLLPQAAGPCGWALLAAMVLALAACDEPAAPVTHSLTITGWGNGAGTIFTDPFGIECESIIGQVSGACEAGFPEGTVVTLSVVPASTSAFAGWDGACTGSGACLVTMQRDRSLTVRFDQAVLLTIVPTGSGGGTVSSQGGVNPEIICGYSNGIQSGNCSGLYAFGAIIILVAGAEPGSAFSGWTGPCEGTSTCAVQTLFPVALGAAFEAVAPRPPPAAARLPIAPGAVALSAEVAAGLHVHRPVRR